MQQPSELKIRQEQAADFEAIYALTELAFRGRSYAGGDEQDVIDRLRSVGALTVSLVAEVAMDLVGHIAFSPATAEDGSGPWFALGPVSVVPDRQGLGIGAALIEAGLARIGNLGSLGCILTGNPDYYRRFGFHFAEDNVPVNESAAYFMVKPFSSPLPRGRFQFHPAFYGDLD